MTYLLNSYRLFHYLIGKNGIYDVPKSIKGGVKNLQHEIFNVEWNNGTKWFVKQPFCLHPSEFFNIVNEAKIAQRINEIPALRGCSPEYIHYNPVHKILITGYLSEYVTFREQSRTRIAELLLSRNLPEKMAFLTANCHLHLTGSVKSSTEYIPLYYFKPSFLTNNLALINPLLDGHTDSIIDKKWLSSLFFQPGVRETIFELNSLWKTNSIIHGDASSDNILIKLKNTDEVIVQLCDWEFAGWGDADWDCACFFQELIIAYMDMHINHSMLIDAGRRYYQAYTEVYNNSDFVVFSKWFTRVLRLAAVGILEKMLAKLMKPDKDIDKNIPDLAEFLVNSVLINPHILKSF